MAAPAGRPIDRPEAVARAGAAVAASEPLGICVLVTGSLARGGFRAGSDIDLLVTACPRSLKYAIEGIVEDCLGEIPFDVVYLDEIPAAGVARFTDGAVHARDLPGPR